MSEINNKQTDIKELKHRVAIRRLVFYPLFFAGITFFVLGCVYSIFLFVALCAVFFAASIVAIVLLGKKIGKLKKRIETYCPKCNSSSLTHARKTKENAGTIQLGGYSRGLIWGKKKLIRETNYYKCTNCGYETHLESTSVEG